MAHLKVTLILALKVILFFNILLAQSSDHSSLNYQYFNQSTGYYEGVNNPIYEDSLGFVWLYGSDGLHRFDGTHMELMISASDTIKGTSIRGMLGPLYEADNGMIWIKYSNSGFWEKGRLKII